MIHFDSPKEQSSIIKEQLVLAVAEAMQLTTCIRRILKA